MSPTRAIFMHTRSKVSWIVIITLIIVSQYFINAGINKKQSQVRSSGVTQLNQHIVEVAPISNDKADELKVNNETDGYVDKMVFWNELALQTVPKGKIL